ncbi:alpha-N-acetylgalactosamine-specific lectin-like [Ciona intestinalis]
MFLLKLSCVVLLIGLLHVVVQAEYTWYGPGNGYVYFVINTNMNYDEAESQCRIYGATLAVQGPKDRKTMKKINERLPVTTREDYWIGLTDRVTDGQFVWADGTPLTNKQKNWRVNEPSNYGGSEDCVGENFSHSLKWNDYPCDYGELYALCERPE